MLTKEYTISMLCNGEWKVFLAETCTIRRYVPVVFAPVCVDGVQLTIHSTWGNGKAHLFAFEPR